MTMFSKGLSPDTEELRIVLFGKTGSGKSSTGNTILGQEKFETPASGFTATTQFCSKRSVKINGRTVRVIDTPGVFDPARGNQEVQHEVARCLLMSAPGPHVLLFVTKGCDRFTQEEWQAYHILRNLFGDDVNKYIIVLFAQGDMFKKHNINIKDEIEKHGKNVDYCEMKNPANIRNILKDVGQRYLVFDNKTDDPEVKDKQVLDLIKEIENLVEGNGGRPYFCDPKTREATEAIERRIDEIMNADKDTDRIEAFALVQEEIRRVFRNIVVGGALGGAGGAIATFMATSAVLTPVFAVAVGAGVAALGARAAAQQPQCAVI